MYLIQSSNTDIDRLKEDLINYFNTAINPFDVDITNPEEIENYSFDKLIEVAKDNGFNLKNYEIEEE